VNREQRDQAVHGYQEFFKDGQVMVLAQYDGLTVKAMTELRRKLRAAEGRLKVVKNTLLGRALSGSAHEGLKPHLAGPLAVAFTKVDPAPLLRALVDFGKVEEKIRFKAISLGGRVYQGAELVMLSKLPGMRELRGQLLSVFVGPQRKFLSLLGTSQRNFLGLLNARKSSLEKAA